MGEIADDLIRGRACSWCGEYFLDPEFDDMDVIYEHGYPVVCKPCWSSATPEEKEGMQKAKVETI